MELGARSERRSVTSFVEGAVEQYLSQVRLREGNVDVNQLAVVLWDPVEGDRFVKLALRFPELLSFEEQLLWKTICECDALWRCPVEQRRDLGPREAEQALDFPALRAHWEALKLVATGDMAPERLPAALQAGLCR
jgi:hypothetical protein